MQRRENKFLADRRSNAMPVHVRSQVSIDASEDQVDSAALQIVAQITQGTRGRVVDIRHRACVDHKPAYRRRSVFYQRTHFIGKAIVVRVEQIRAEPIDHQTGFCLETRLRRHWRPPARLVRCQHRRMRTIAVAYMPKQRQRDRQQNALLKPDQCHYHSRDNGQLELAGTLATDVAQTSVYRRALRR